MITWLQNTLQHRFRYVFFALLVATLIAFVFANDIFKGLSSLGSKTPKRMFYGINLADDYAKERMLDDACANVLLNLGTLPTKNDTLFQFALKRHALIYHANQACIPASQEGNVLEYIKKLRYFKNDAGEFDEIRYKNFCFNSKITTGTKISIDDFIRVIGDDIRIDELEKLIAGPGYVLPCEIEQIINHENTIWTLISATVELSERPNAIFPSNEQLIQYFEGRRSHYKISPRIRADYIEFKADQFINSIVVTEDEIRSFFDENPLRFPKSSTGSMKILSREASYDFARSSAKAMLLRQRAQSLASTAAEELSATLFREKVDPNSPAFSNLLSKNNLSLISLASFSTDEFLSHFGKKNTSIVRECLSIDASNPYSNPISTEKSSIILIWRESIPEREAELSEVRKTVEADYMKDETQKRIASMGDSIKQQTDASLETGLDFQTAISKAAQPYGARVKIANHAPFSLRQRDSSVHGNYQSSMLGAADINILKGLKQGGVSEMIIVNDTTFRFIFASTVKYPDLEKNDSDYIKFEQDLSSKRSKNNLEGYIKSLVDTELEKANEQ